MNSTRRQFIASVVAAATGSLAVTKPMHRPTIDIDLSRLSLLNAMGVVGTGPYVLRVHPVQLGYARSLLCRTFPRDDWRRDFTVAVGEWDDIDTWALESPSSSFFTIGA